MTEMTDSMEAPHPDALTLLSEATRAFRALLTQEGVSGLDGTPKMTVRWGPVVGEGGCVQAPVATVEAWFTLILPHRLPPERPLEPVAAAETA
jgi:hypothetical protein